MFFGKGAFTYDITQEERGLKKSGKKCDTPGSRHVLYAQNSRAQNLDFRVTWT